MAWYDGADTVLSVRSLWMQNEIRQSTHSLQCFQEYFLNMHVTVLLIRPDVHEQTSKIYQMTDKRDRLKPKAAAKHV